MMRAVIITTRTMRAQAMPKAWVSRVVSEQDYEHGGFAAHSHRTAEHASAQAAANAAAQWCKANGFEVVASPNDL